MSLSDTISEQDRQRLYFEFTKSLIDRRILYKGKKVEKFEVFATFLSKCKDRGDLIVKISYLLTNSLPDYKIVWKWELLGFRDSLY